MADLYTDIATKQASESTKTVPQEVGGRVRCAHGTVTPGTEAAGTKIYLAKLPKGARVLPSSKLHVAAGQGGTLTLKCGDAADDDRYLVAVAPGASAVTLALDANVHTPYSLADEGWIFLTSGVAALAAAAITCEIFYVVD